MQVAGLMTSLLKMLGVSSHARGKVEQSKLEERLDMEVFSQSRLFDTPDQRRHRSPPRKPKQDDKPTPWQ